MPPVYRSVPGVVVAMRGDLFELGIPGSGRFGRGNRHSALIWQLLGHGGRTAPELVADLSALFPELPAETLAPIVSQTLRWFAQRRLVEAV